MKRIFLLSLFILGINSFAVAQDAEMDKAGSVSESTQASSETKDESAQPKEEGHSFGHKLLFYIPNRVLDVLDIFRARVRVGPGIAAGVRATKVAQAYVGTYASVYAGLPGPRMRRIPRSPIGLESYNGVAVSVVDATVGGGIGPDYSPTEFGVSVQPLLFGFDIGFDPVEVVDFAAGLLMFDIRDDDI